MTKSGPEDNITDDYDVSNVHNPVVVDIDSFFFPDFVTHF